MKREALLLARVALTRALDGANKGQKIGSLDALAPTQGGEDLAQGLLKAAHEKGLRPLWAAVAGESQRVVHLELDPHWVSAGKPPTK